MWRLIMRDDVAAVTCFLPTVFPLGRSPYVATLRNALRCAATLMRGKVRAHGYPSSKLSMAAFLATAFPIRIRLALIGVLFLSVR